MRPNDSAVRNSVHANTLREQRMRTTLIGAQVGMRDITARRLVAERLMRGQDSIETYMQGVCYDVVAYVRYLLGANITPTTLRALEAEQWVPQFDFTAGTIWEGGSIPTGTAVGFESQLTERFSMPPSASVPPTFGASTISC